MRKIVSRKTGKRLFVNIILIIACLLFLVPVIIGLLNSFKPLTDVLLHPLDFGLDMFTLDNYLVAFRQMKYATRFFNTFFVTASSSVIILFLSSMAAYKLSRENTIRSSIVLKFIIMFILVPFQCTMVPLVVQMSDMGLNNKHLGLILGYIGFLSPMSIFLYHGYIKSVPVELDESARIDGCSSFGIFFRIIFPLLKPITSTVIIINAMAIWNDYLFPAIMIQKESKKTLVIGLTTFATSYQKQWGRLLAATFMVIAPIMLIYIFLQKYIINGLVSGALKS